MLYQAERTVPVGEVAMAIGCELYAVREGARKNYVLAGECLSLPRQGVRYVRLNASSVATLSSAQYQALCRENGLPFLYDGCVVRKG